MLIRLWFALLAAAVFVGCSSDPIRNRPISFSEWRKQETIRYINNRYNRSIDSLEMLPVMIVVHYTAMDSLETSFNYLNNEEMESGRGLLKSAGGANIAVQFLVAKSGEIFRLMPENHIGRHVIGLNRHAIGIENVGANEQALTNEQVAANAYIIRHLTKRFPIKYLIAHSDYRKFEKTPLWEEQDTKYRTEKFDPGESFMQPLMASVADLGLKREYDGSEVPVRLAHLLENYHRAGAFTGTALVCRRGKILFHEAYGIASESERSYIASSAKPLTAVAIAQLVEQKKLRYETDVAAYFPQLKHLLRGVKVRHLLSHTSGLDDYYRLRTATPGLTNAEAIEALTLQKKRLFPPGKKFHYANSNYVLLAEIAARAAEKPFEELIRAQIFAPADMAQSLFRTEFSDEAKLVLTATDATGNEFRYPYLTKGAGGVYATTADLLRFDQSLLSGRLVGTKTFAAMQRPVAHVDQRDAEYAQGWYTFRQRPIIFHDGNFNGYHAMNWIDPKKQEVIILLSNRHSTRIKEITYEIDRILNGLSATPLK